VAQRAAAERAGAGRSERVQVKEDMMKSGWRTIPWPVMEALMAAYKNQSAVNLPIDYGRVSASHLGVKVQFVTEPDGKMPLADVENFFWA
jgi:hypothetical protein